MNHWLIRLRVQGRASGPAFVLGLVREYQMNTYKARYEGISLYDLPYYDKIAEAYGMEYLHIENNDEVIPTIEKFLGMEEPCLMVVEVADDNNVK